MQKVKLGIKMLHMGRKKIVSGLFSGLLMFPVPFLFVLVLMGLSGFFTYNIIRDNPESFGLLKGQDILQKEEADFIKKVGSKIELPDEQPTVATVAQLDQLAGQPFFANAKEGDKVLIYQQAKKVILYRPSEERIVEVGSLNIVEQPNPDAVDENELNVNLRVGVVTVGNADQSMELLQSKLDELGGYEVVSTSNAQGFYRETMVVDLGAGEEIVGKIAEELGGVQVGKLDAKDQVEGVDLVVVLFGGLGGN